jgi:hypothetical protein
VLAGPPRWLPLLGLALVGACHREPLPRPPTGPQGPRPPGAPCDFEAEYPPPPAQIEVVERTGVPEDPACAWIDGHWQWEGRRWTWIAGGWFIAPRGCHFAGATAYWIPGSSRGGKLCTLYPGFFADRDGARCATAPCGPPRGGPRNGRADPGATD